jgi:hypothetical protein
MCFACEFRAKIDFSKLRFEERFDKIFSENIGIVFQAKTMTLSGIKLNQNG